jgi:phage terminase small subunit
MRGRKPKPTALKLLEGNPGHRPIDSLHEPAAEPGLGEPPPELEHDPEAIRVWLAEGPRLVKMGTLSLCDAHLFATYCQSVSENKLLSDQMQRLGRKKRPTTEEINALATITNSRRKAQAMALKLGAEFGIGAASRTRIKLSFNDGQLALPGVDAPSPDDPLARIISGMAGA